MRSVMVNLPVRNLRVSAAFFAELGFMSSPGASGPDTACLVIDQNITVMLTAAERYRDRVNCDASCTGSAGEVLLCCRIVAGPEPEQAEETFPAREVPNASLSASGPACGPRSEAGLRSLRLDGTRPSGTGDGRAGRSASTWGFHVL